MNEDAEPRYVISVAAGMLSIKAHNLRYYERVGIVQPLRSRGNIRLYSERDIAQLRRIKTLMDDLGVNLAGVEVVLRMSQRIIALQNRLDEVESELERLRQAGL